MALYQCHSSSLVQERTIQTCVGCNNNNNNNNNNNTINGKFICVFECTIVNLTTYRQITKAA